MKFGEKLGMLMATYETNMSKLAKGINVDPSLISKWRKGCRKLSANSPLLISMADYFFNANTMEFQKKRLVELLEKEAIKFDHNDDSIKRALVEWLAASEYKNGDEETSVKSETSKNEQFPLKEIAYHEIYKGIAGKRQAVLKFLYSILEEEEPLELLLSSEEDMQWLIEDKEFFLKWADLLKRVIAKGNRIKIIHSVNREPGQIKMVIEKWMPLHLTGKIESYYVPRYSETNIKTTLFIARNKSAVIAFSPLKKAEADYTFFYRDSAMLQVAESMFFSYLSSCQKLFNTFTKENPSDYFMVLEEYEKLRADCIEINNCLSINTMPSEVFKSLIEKIETKDENRNIRIQQHNKRLLEFENNLREYSHIEVGFIEPQIINDTIICSSLTLFNGSVAVYTIQEYLLHLKRLAYLLKTYDNYQFIILDKNMMESFRGLQVLMKQEIAAIIACSGCAGTNPAAISVTEPTVLSAFHHYLIDYLECIPKVLRRKERTLGILEALIKKLSKETID